MPLEASKVKANAGELAWLALPFLAFLALSSRLWFNAPRQDDYDALIGGTMRLLDAGSFAEWWNALVWPHNEHRIVLTRAAAWIMAKVGGSIDFWWLALLGNLALGAILMLLWAQVRGRVGPPMLAAAAFAVCQLSYFESATLAMGAWSNLGVLAFAFATFHFALRPGRGNATLGLAFGLLAAGSQGNGLLALLLAAIACFVGDLKPRAALYGAAGCIVCLLYSIGYQTPAQHGSPFDALNQPLVAAQLFVMHVGAIAPGRWPATVFGIALLGLLASLAGRGYLRDRPTLATFVAFILLSAAAAAVARVGLGVHWASRYAINSSCLVAVALLLLAAQRGWGAGASWRALTACAMGSLIVSWAIWPHASMHAFQGRLLVSPLPDSPAAVVEPYVGVYYPYPEVARRLLAEAEQHGIYHVRDVPVFATQLRTSLEPVQAARTAGMIESVRVNGAEVVVDGWTEVPATVRGRSFTASAPEVPRSTSLAIVGRTDMAIRTGRSDLLLSGFQWKGSYESEAQARRAAKKLCLVIEAPGYMPAALQRGQNCTG